MWVEGDHQRWENSRYVGERPHEKELGSVGLGVMGGDHEETIDS